MKPFLKKYPLFLLLLPLFILIHIEKKYYFLTYYKFVYKELAILFIVPFFIYLICLILLRSFSKAAVHSFVILSLFYFLGEIKDSLREYFDDSIIHSYKLLIPVGIIIVTTSYLIIRKKEDWGKVILYLNSVVIVAILIDLFTFFLIKKSDNTNSKIVSDFAYCSTCEKPDIYYIIFDSYSSSSILRQEFSYNNSEIESNLKENGFQIISGSKSNYNLTPFCISSTFDLNYIPEVDTTKKHLIKDYHNMIERIYTNSLFTILKNQGYNIYNHSIFDVKDFPSTVPRFDEWKTYRLFQQYNIVRKTYNEIGWQLPRWIKISFGREPSETYLDERNAHDSATLDHLFSTIELNTPSPKFVYSHILIPHSPYMFDSSGKKIKPAHFLTPEEDKKAYINQLIYSTSIMKRLLEKIKPTLQKPAVVIIQGDHGYRFFDPSKTQYEFPNLNAIYFPPKYNFIANDSITGVNTFRLVLNKLFKQNYPILPVKTFFLRYQ